MSDTAVVTFGKYSVLTKGHITVFDKMANLAKQRNADMRVYLSHDVKPLSYEQKIQWARKSVPRYKDAIISSKARNIFDIMVDVYDAGYRNVVVVVGSDRVAEFSKLIPKYNSVNARHGYYEFDSIDVTVAGEERSSGATGVAGLSSTKLRKAASEGDFETFASGVSNELSDREKKRYYEEIRKAMGVREGVTSFRDYLTEKVTKSDLDQIEKYADKLFAKVGVDVEFTKHFHDRVNDKRNKKPITTSELIRIFRETYKRYGKIIPTMGPDAQAVLRDMETDINVPFVLNVDKNGELDLVNKTIMRKRGFKTSNPVLSFEETEEENPCWDGYEMIGWKKKNGKKVPNCVPKETEEVVVEKKRGEYDGRTVDLEDPFRLKNDDKKFGVYVKNDKGNVVLVKFGDADMEIKRDDPERRKSFRARHNCDDQTDKTSAAYWSCLFWSNKTVSELLKDSRQSFKQELRRIAESVISNM